MAEEIVMGRVSGQPSGVAVLGRGVLAKCLGKGRRSGRRGLVVQQEDRKCLVDDAIGSCCFAPRPSPLCDFEFCKLERVPRVAFAQVGELVSHVLHLRCNRGWVLLVKNVLKVLLERGLPVGVVKQVVLPFACAGQLFLGTVCPPISLARGLIELGVPLLELQLVHRLHLFPSESAPSSRRGDLRSSPLLLEFPALCELVHGSTRVGHVLADGRDPVVDVPLHVGQVQRFLKVLSQVPLAPKFVELLALYFVGQRADDGLMVGVSSDSVFPNNMATLQVDPSHCQVVESSGLSPRVREVRRQV